MSAAIQLVNQPMIEAEVYEHRLEKPFTNNVSIFELAPEQRLRRAMSQIAELQAEVRALREELARSERTFTHQEQLLRNAMVREQELRSQLGKELF
ncbi:MAG TPA: hypothetical protein PLK30_06680 [Blastocatellia bacterium]|nr:hypothetical protein [Blastocatellia bacterium]